MDKKNVGKNNVISFNKKSDDLFTEIGTAYLEHQKRKTELVPERIEEFHECYEIISDMFKNDSTVRVTKELHKPSNTHGVIILRGKTIIFRNIAALMSVINKSASVAANMKRDGSVEVTIGLRGLARIPGGADE